MLNPTWEVGDRVDGLLVSFFDELGACVFC